MRVKDDLNEGPHVSAAVVRLATVYFRVWRRDVTLVLGPNTSRWYIMTSSSNVYTYCDFVRAHRKDNKYVVHSSTFVKDFDDPGSAIDCLAAFVYDFAEKLHD